MSNIEIEVCEGCGIEFGAPVHFLTARRRDGKLFYCPNGHSLSFGESEADKLRRERDRLKQRAAQLQDDAEEERRRASAFKGQITRLKNRASKGVCPCCNRSFQNLRRHMESQHPSFTDEVPEAAE